MLAIKNISKYYGGFKALDKISFTIPTGEIVGILGPDGAGKTTLLRIINQVLHQDEGIITIGGEMLQPKHVSDIGYLPEERGLYKQMLVKDQLIYIAQLRGLSYRQAKKNLDNWLERLFIAEWKDERIGKLSEGIQQKVQFITAVIHNPNLIILDEPFTEFDPINFGIIKQNILDLNDQGATILISTKDMGSVEQLCSSIVLINKSKKVLEGTVSDIREAFKEPVYSISFKGAKGIFNNNNKVTVLSEQTTCEINNLIVKLSDEYMAGEFIKDSMLENINLINFSEVTPSLNEIFIKIVDLNELVK